MQSLYKYVRCRGIDLCFGCLCSCSCVLAPRVLVLLSQIPVPDNFVGSVILSNLRAQPRHLPPRSLVDGGADQVRLLSPFAISPVQI